MKTRFLWVEALGDSNACAYAYNAADGARWPYIFGFVLDLLNRIVDTDATVYECRVGAL
jgi:hypothetical protein